MDSSLFGPLNPFLQVGCSPVGEIDAFEAGHVDTFPYTYTQWMKTESSPGRSEGFNEGRQHWISLTEKSPAVGDLLDSIWDHSEVASANQITALSSDDTELLEGASSSQVSIPVEIRFVQDQTDTLESRRSADGIAVLEDKDGQAPNDCNDIKQQAQSTTVSQRMETFYDKLGPQYQPTSSDLNSSSFYVGSQNSARTSQKLQAMPVSIQHGAISKSKCCLRNHHQNQAGLIKIHSAIIPNKCSAVGETLLRTPPSQLIDLFSPSQKLDFTTSIAISVSKRELLNTLHIWHFSLGLENPSTPLLALHFFFRRARKLGAMCTYTARVLMCVCLWVAIKLVDRVNIVPSVTKMALVAGVSAQSLRIAELPLLDALHWNLIRP